MTHLDKPQRAAKQAQIKRLISSALEYFYPEDLLEMLMNECPSDMKDDLVDKCAEVCTENNLLVLQIPNYEDERTIKTVCKDLDIKIKTY